MKARSFLLLAVALLLSPSLAAADSPAEDAPAGRTVTLRGVKIYYESVGEGEPLLLLHSGTRTGRMYDPFREELSARYRLIVPDLRGHGGSTNPEGEWSTREMALDMIALLDHLGIERVRGVGASVGGITLLHMATLAPERVEAMVLVGVGTYIPVSCREILDGTNADDYPEAVWQRLRQRHRHGDDQIRALYAWVDSLAESYNDLTFTPAYLATVTARTLVVHGDRDYCFPASMAWDIYQAIPRAWLWVVPNGGHVPIDGALAPRFTETVLAFLGGAWEKE